MRQLVERWPRLADIPHRPLGTFPTPLSPLSSLSRIVGAEVWAKRDELCGPLYGGNKVRKLEFLLAQAASEGADTILTTGAIGSHHVLATALYGREAGFDVHAVVLPQPKSPHAIENARAIAAAGATLHPVRHYALLPAAMAAIGAKLKLGRRRIFAIGPGGSDATGAMGWVEGGLEIAHQLSTEQPRDFDAIYAALGSGGTAVGLALGLAAAGITTEIVAVRVTPKRVIRRAVLGSLARGLVQRLRMIDDRFPPVADLAMQHLKFEEDFLGDGYGVATDPALAAIELLKDTEQMKLDIAYTGKVMAALIAHAQTKRKGQRILYVHTLSASGAQAGIDAPLPDSLSSLFV